MLKAQKGTLQYTPKPGQSEIELLKKYAGKDGLFRDPDFPADCTSLFIDGEAPEGHIPANMVQWLRPAEYVPPLAEGRAPCIFTDAANPGDVVQGGLGDCWFLSALSCVASRPDLLQGLFASTEYASKGIYTVRFFKNGKWKHVSIDDRIPCSPTGKPLYARCKEPHQVWVTLLEKAYAKVNGRCYQNLISGTMTYALKDLTGGDPQVVNLLDPQTADECNNGFLWQKFKLWVKQRNLLGSCYSLPRKEKREEEFDGGIVRGHAYSIIDVKEHHDLKFMQIRNPWGMKEWKGRWADHAPEWDDLPQDAPDWMQNYRPDDDGVFWMLFDDFIRYFNTIYVCIMFPSSWTEEFVKGRWTQEASGGHPRHPNSWWLNPTYRLTVYAKTQLFISLAQKDMRMYGNQQGENSRRSWNSYDHAVGFMVARESAVSRCKRTHGDAKLKGSDIVAKGYPFKKDRDVSVVSFPVVLEPQGGPYVLIPMTYDPGADLKYYCTVRSNKHIKLEEYSVPTQFDPDAEMEEDEDEDEDEEETLKSAVQRDEDFTEREIQLTLTQAEIIAMCKKGVESLWVKDQGGGFKFEDASFAPDLKSIFLDPKRPLVNLNVWNTSADQIRWLRPSQINLESYMPSRGQGAPPVRPVLFKEGAALPGDVVQGALTDCWFLGGLSTLATRPELLSALFVNHSPACEQYGVYTVRFYKGGEWKDVVIDDRLPCTQDRHFLFARAKDPTELWVPLLEKAYAKLHSCYECLSEGTMGYALKDLTAGAPQTVKFSDPDVESRIKNGMLWKEAENLLRSGSLLGCAVREEGKKGHKQANRSGLLAGHTYAVLELKEFDLKRMGMPAFRDDPILRLIKVRNPWGKGDFNGAWSPKSEYWKKYEQIALECRFKEFEQGSFWIASQDFFTTFTTMYVNRMFNEPWHALRHTDAWIKATDEIKGTAFGAPDPKNPSAWLGNPQFRVYVKQKTPCFIVLSQKDSRMKGETATLGEYENAIGFAVAKESVMREKGARMKKSDFFALTTFRQDRDVATPFTLQLSPKDSPYVIIPMTYTPGRDGAFVLNIWVKNEVFVRGGEHVEVLEHAHDDSDEDVDAFDKEDVEAVEEAIVANADSMPGVIGKAKKGLDGKSGTSSAGDEPEAGAAASRTSDGDLYNALLTICTELGGKLNTDQKRGLVKALGLN